MPVVTLSKIGKSKALRVLFLTALLPACMAATKSVSQNSVREPGSNAASAPIASGSYNWSRSLAVDFQSPTIGALGGTEARSLVSFDGKLYSGIGYWRDTMADNPQLPGAQVIRLDSAIGAWQIDLALNDVINDGRAAGKRRYQAIGALNALTVSADRDGKTLPQPVSILLASVWDRIGGLRLFAKGTGPAAKWNFVDLVKSAPASSQIRSFGSHVDRVTGRQLLFAGTSPFGVFSGGFDRQAPAFISWSAQPESWPQTDAAGNQKRIMGFAECSGKFYASAGFELFERQDGPNPSWQKIYTYENPSNNPQVSGFRGMRAVPSLTGVGEELLIAVENTPFTIIRVNPQAAQPSGLVELDASAALTRDWGTRVAYGIAAYNEMTSVRFPGASCDSLLIGFEARTPQDPTAIGEGHKHASANYFVRNCDASYNVFKIDDPRHPGLPACGNASHGHLAV